MSRGKRLPLHIIAALAHSKEHQVSPTHAARIIGIRPALAMRYYQGKTSNSLPYAKQREIITEKYVSVSSYQKRMADIRQSRFENILFAHYIKSRIQGRTQADVAVEIAVSADTLSKYKKGHFIPREEKQLEIFQALESTPTPRFSTLDEYVGYVMSTCMGDHSAGYE